MGDDLAIRRSENGRNTSRDPRIYRGGREGWGPSRRSRCSDPRGGIYYYLISLRACGGPPNSTNPPPTDEKSAVVRDSDMAILDGTKGRPRVGNYLWRKRGLGIMCPTRESLMWTPIPTVDRRIASNNDLRLGTTSNRSLTPEDPLKIVPTRMSSPLTARRFEAGL